MCFIIVVIVVFCFIIWRVFVVQLILKPTPAGSGPGGEFTLEDGVQPQLELVSAERDLIAATFTQLLIANCGGEDTFKVREWNRFR